MIATWLSAGAVGEAAAVPQIISPGGIKREQNNNNNKKKSCSGGVKRAKFVCLF